MKTRRKLVLLAFALFAAVLLGACAPSIPGIAQSKEEVHESVPELPVAVTGIMPVLHGCNANKQLSDNPGWSFIIDGYGHGQLRIELRTFAGGSPYATTTLDFRGQLGNNETEVIPALFKGQIVGETYVWIGGPDGPVASDGPYELLC